MKIQTKIIILFLSMILIFAVISGLIVNSYSKDIIKNQIYDHLETAAQGKAYWINLYFSERKSDVSILASLPLVKHALEEEALDFGAEGQSLMKEREKYLINFKEYYGYYDLFLISSSGDIWWTAEHESDFGTNLETGLYKDTNLARVYREAKANGRNAFFSDFEYYAPSGKIAAFFAAAPVYDNDKVIGVVALQTNIDQINVIMQDRVGLGETGEAYLIGPDKLMRSDSRFFEESTILKQKVDTKNSRECIEDLAKGASIEETLEGHGFSVFTDYRGIEVLGTHVYILEMQWCLLAEIDVEEALAPISKMRNVVIILGLLIIIISVILSFIIAKTLSDPIKKLKESTTKIKQGNLNEKIEVKSKDEIGELAKTFDDMRLGLKDRNQLLNSLLKTFKGKFGNLATILVRKDIQELTKKNPRIEKILPKSLGISVTKAKKFQRESRKKT